SRVAEKLDAQDYRLRRLINGHLGYRNFNDFLNTYRVEAAKADLHDPEKAHLPILTIAMDLGYRSLASFNRAFKELTGSTPSEFRQNAPSGGESAGSSPKS
ncbi:MAG: helix-turn-helix domain-containing protein, partial [Alphaproteobacteria bacterium]|nr:helix-turn-helix domain-containing protein [Alphaproteobacteria bacterium]